MTYTPKQVSQMLKIRPSTLRLYAKEFSEYLSTPDDRLPGQHRLYTENDLIMLQRIKELRATHTPIEAIGPNLRIIEPTENREDKSLLLIPSIASAIEQALAAARAADRRAEHLANQVEQLADQVKQQADLLQELNNYLSQPWYKRVFKQRPSPSTNKTD